MRTRKESTSSQRGVQSAEVALRLLRVLVEAGKPMMLRDLAASAHMPPAKAHRYLVSLARQGFVEQEGTGGLYNLGAYALELALASLARLDHVRLASEALHDLCRRVDETVALAVWGNRGPVFVRWEEPAAHPVATNVRVGSVVPVLSSASGLVFAAFLPAEEVSPFIAAEIKQRAPTNHAKLRTRREVDTLLARVRGERLARVAGDLLSGVDALSVPVFDHRSRVVLAITALGDERRFDASPHGRIARALRETGDAVSRRLGYREEAAGTAS